MAKFKKEKEMKHIDELVSVNPIDESKFIQKGSSSIKSIHPLGMRVVIRLRPETDQTDSGLFIPEGSKEKTAESLLGQVLEVARAADENDEEDHNISGIPEGALVLISKAAGIKVPWDDQLRIVDTKDVLAIVSVLDVN